MARVVFLPAHRRYTGGIAEIEVAARDFREAVQAIGERFPDLPEHELERCSVAIDGEIVNSPLLEPLDEHSELIFLTRIGAG